MKVRFSISLHRYSDLSDDSPRALARCITIPDDMDAHDAAWEARYAEFPDRDGLPATYYDKSGTRWYVGPRRTVYVAEAR